MANLPPVSLIAVASCHRRRDTVGKFANGIVDTSGKVSTVSTTLAKLVEKFAAGVVDTGGAPWISPRTFEKIRNGLIVILWDWGKTDSWKKPEAKNLVTLFPLSSSASFDDISATCLCEQVNDSYALPPSNPEWNIILEQRKEKEKYLHWPHVNPKCTQYKNWPSVNAHARD